MVTPSCKDMYISDVLYADFGYLAMKIACWTHWYK